MKQEDIEQLFQEFGLELDRVECHDTGVSGPYGLTSYYIRCNGFGLKFTHWPWEQRFTVVAQIDTDISRYDVALDLVGTLNVKLTTVLDWPMEEGGLSCSFPPVNGNENQHLAEGDFVLFLKHFSGVWNSSPRSEVCLAADI